MTHRTMENTIEANSYFVSDDGVVAQDSVCFIGAGLENLVIEFDETMYKKFLQGSAGAPNPMRSSERICVPSRVPTLDAHQIIQAHAQPSKAVPTTRVRANRPRGHIFLLEWELSVPEDSPFLWQNRNA